MINEIDRYLLSVMVRDVRMSHGVFASVQDARPIFMGAARGYDLDHSSLSGDSESSIVVVEDDVKGGSESVQIERYFTVEE